MLYVGVLWYVCSVPFVTLGAASTALFEVLMQMEKDTEGYIGASFLRSFKNNFKQATSVWIPILFTEIIFGVNMVYYALLSGGRHPVEKVVFIVLFTAVMALTGYIFPVLAKFDNTVGDTFRLAIVLLARKPGWTIMILTIQILTVFVCYFFVYMPVLFIMGITGYLQAAIFNHIFDGMIERGEITEKETERIAE
jgi:uncharacterized membrane protein YesL